MDAITDIPPADDIGFTPDPARHARPAAVPPAPTWLAASIAVTVALLLGVSLAVRPASAVAHGATGDVPASADDTPATHQELFPLPAWHDDAKPDDRSAVADAR